MIRKNNFALGIASAVIFVGNAAVAATLSFTQGVGGYNSGTDIYVAREATTNAAAPTEPTTDSVTLEEIWIDQDGTGIGSYGAVIYKFSDVFGSGAGQIGVGSEIVSASLSLSSGTTSAYADTSGDPRVFGALSATSVATTFQDLSGLDGTAQSTGGYLHGTQSGFLTPWQSFFDGHGNAETLDYDVTGYLRAVSAGNVLAENLALVATNNSTNGWQLFTNIAADTAKRPTLNIEYSAARTQHTAILDSGYATVVQLGGQGANTIEVKTSGNVSVDGTTDSFTPNDQAIIKFDITSEVPAGAALQQARLVTVTGTGAGASGDTNNIDAGITVRQILVDWDVNDLDAAKPTLPLEFGTEFGIQNTEGEASNAYVDMNGNFLDGTKVSNLGFDSLAVGEEYVFDVTEIVQDWIDNGNNYGFVLTKYDSDGWAFEASTVQLQLDYTTASSVPEPTSALLAGVGLLGCCLAGRRRRNRRGQ
jgi:hypothetical protein